MLLIAQSGRHLRGREVTVTSAGNTTIELSSTSGTANVHFDIETNDQIWRIRTDGGDSDIFKIRDVTGGADAIQIEKGVDDNTLYLDSGGLIGFGTDNPNINGHFYDNTTDANVGVKLENDARAWQITAHGSESDRFKIRDVTGTADPFQIIAGADDNSFYMDSAGRVGLATVPNSLVQLHVYENDTSGYTTRVEQDGTGDAGTYYVLTGEYGWTAGIDNTDNHFKIDNGETLGDTPILVLDGANQRLGVGKVPTVSLDVVGGIHSTGDTTFSTSGAGLLYGEISVVGNTTETTITTSGKANKVQFSLFDTNGLSNGTTPDQANEQLTIMASGIYLITVSIHVDSVTGSDATFGFSIWKNDAASEFTNIHAHTDLPAGGGKTRSASLSGIISLATSDDLELWVWNEDNTNNLIISDCTMSVVMIGS
jgi:hypothetical protein